MDSKDVLEAKGLVKVYNGKRVVDQIEMTLRREEIVGLLGPNGAGKTTTFYMIIGFTRPHEGKVYLDGEDITEAPMYLRARKGINYLAQEPSVFRKLTVEENLFAIMENINIPGPDIKQRAMNLLSELNISHLANKRPHPCPAVRDEGWKSPGPL